MYYLYSNHHHGSLLNVALEAVDLVMRIIWVHFTVLVTADTSIEYCVSTAGLLLVEVVTNLFCEVLYRVCIVNISA